MVFDVLTIILYLIIFAFSLWAMFRVAKEIQGKTFSLIASFIFLLIIILFPDYIFYHLTDTAQLTERAVSIFKYLEFIFILLVCFFWVRNLAISGKMSKNKEKKFPIFFGFFLGLLLLAFFASSLFYRIYSKLINLFISNFGPQLNYLGSFWFYLTRVTLLLSLILGIILIIWSIYRLLFLKAT